MRGNERRVLMNRDDGRPNQREEGRPLVWTKCVCVCMCVCVCVVLLIVRLVTLSVVGVTLKL